MRNTQHHTNKNSKTRTPQYALRKGLGFWEVTFAGQSAVFKHEQGAYYVAYLLLNPPAEPIHALDLVTRVSTDLNIENTPPSPVDIDLDLAQLNLRENPAQFRERGFCLEDAQTARALYLKLRQLRALLQDPHQFEPVKREAKAELEIIDTFLRRNCSRIRDNAQRAADAVGKALKRFHRHLANALDAQANPQPVLQAFAQHLHHYLLTPSGRSGFHGGPRPEPGLAGCFTYEPPTGVRWSA